MESYIRRFLCSWDRVATDKSHAAALARFLNEKLGLEWVGDMHFTEGETENGSISIFEMDSEGKVIKHIAGDNTLTIELEEPDKPGDTETRAVLSEQIGSNGDWKKVYEFTVLTENEKSMYLKGGGNDNLEVSLDNSISGGASMLDSLIFNWDRILSSSSPKDDRHSLIEFLKSNFGLLWLGRGTEFKADGANKITAEGEGHMLAIGRGRQGGRNCVTVYRRRQNASI